MKDMNGLLPRLYGKKELYFAKNFADADSVRGGQHAFGFVFVCPQGLHIIMIMVQQSVVSFLRCFGFGFGFGPHRSSRKWTVLHTPSK